MMNRRFSSFLTAAAVVLVPVTALNAQPAASAVAAPAAASNDTAAGEFIADLSQRAFAVLRETGAKDAARSRFKVMLRENFAVDETGNRLIRRYRSQITPAQLAAYQAALPEYVVNLYSERLYDYSKATVKIVRTAPHGALTDVYSRVETPGRRPVDVIWAVERRAGRPLIANVTVSGVNLALTQEADFSSYIAKNGFDALVAFLKSSNARPVA